MLAKAGGDSVGDMLLGLGRLGLRLLPKRSRPLLAYRLVNVGGSGLRRVMIEGAPLELDLSDWLERLYFLGEYDRDRLRLLKRFAQGGVVVDVGANVGLYTCVLARHAAKVVAFEPDARNFARLQTNVALGGLTNVVTHRVALMDTRDVVEMFLPPNAATPSWVRTKNPGDWESRGSVKAERLDDIFSGDRLDLIKIDVEGSEVPVLHGAERVIREHRPVILCEVHKHSRDGIVRFSQSYGYDCLSLERRSYLRPVEWVSDIQDVLLDSRKDEQPS